MISFEQSTSLAVGQKVMYKGKDATVKFRGKTGFEPGLWIGLEMATPVGAGFHDGSYVDFNVHYFECRKGHGVFVRETQVTSLRVTDSSSAADSVTATNPNPTNLREHARGGAGGLDRRQQHSTQPEERTALRRLSILTPERSATPPAVSGGLSPSYPNAPSVDLEQQFGVETPFPIIGSRPRQKPNTAKETWSRVLRMKHEQKVQRDKIETEACKEKQQLNDAEETERMGILEQMAAALQREAALAKKRQQAQVLLLQANKGTKKEEEDDEEQGPSSDDSSANSTPTTTLVVQKKAPASSSRKKKCHIAVVPSEVIAVIAEFVPLSNKVQNRKMCVAESAKFVKAPLPHPAERRAMTLVCFKWCEALMTADWPTESQYWPTERNRADEIGWSQKRHDKFLELICTGQVDLVDRLLQKGGYVDWGYHVVRFGADRHRVRQMYTDGGLWGKPHYDSAAAVLLRASGVSGLMTLVNSLLEYLHRHRESALSRLVELQNDKHLRSGGELLDAGDLQNEEIVGLLRVLEAMPSLEHCVELVIQGALEGPPQKGERPPQEGRNTKCNGARRKLCLGLIPYLKNLEHPHLALLDEKTPDGDVRPTTLLRLAASMKCCRQCAYEVTAALLKKGANASTPTAKMRTPLHCAVIAVEKVNLNGSLKLISLLIDEGKADVDAKHNPEGNTPAHYAAYGKNDTVMRYLQAKGANLDLPNLWGNTPAMIHAMHVRDAWLLGFLDTFLGMVVVVDVLGLIFLGSKLLGLIFFYPNVLADCARQPLLVREALF